MATEKVHSVFDVGAVTREIRDTYVPVGQPARVQPAHLRPLITWLRRATNEARARFNEIWLDITLHRDRGVFSTSMTQAQQIRAELEAWELRLGIYEAAVIACPDEDAQCTLWSVTAPLFFGFYDGANGTKTGTPDLRTPLQLSNQIAELGGFIAEKLTWSQLWRDALEQSRLVAAGVTEAVAGTLRALGEAAGAIAAGAIKGTAEGLGGTGIAIAAIVVAWFWIRGKRKQRVYAVPAAASEGG